MAKTRSKTERDFIGNIKSSISKTKLPTNRIVLQHFYYLKYHNPMMKFAQIVCCGISKDRKTLICEGDCCCLLRKVISVYNKAGIPIVRLGKAKGKVLNLVSVHKSLCRLRKRDTLKERNERSYSCSILPIE